MVSLTSDFGEQPQANLAKIDQSQGIPETKYVIILGAEGQEGESEMKRRAEGGVAVGNGRRMRFQSNRCDDREGCLQGNGTKLENVA